jgi:glycosyltransferase involved in cell wall biosynthesis
MQLALAITTFDRPDALAAVLATVARQRSAPDEVLVADDGSGPSTAAVVSEFAAKLAVPLRHLRQEHVGFRLTRLRNMAIAAMRADYVVFVDGDMLLHSQFIADHRRIARTGFFTQGVRILLNDATTSAALMSAAERGETERDSWRGEGLRRLYEWHAPRLSMIVRHQANRFIAIKGCNQGFWRADLERVNGFDEAIEGWGPEDKELCARLLHAGVRRQTLLFGGIAWHLAHPPALRDRHHDNSAILAATLATRRARCTRGLDGHAMPREARPGTAVN